MHYYEAHLKNFAKTALDMILPPRCLISGEIVETQGMITPQSWSELQFISAPLCHTCGMPFEFDTDGETQCATCIENPPLYDMGRAAMRYNDTSKKLILGFKHGDQMHATKCFTPWLKAAGEDLLNQTDMLVPVPLHRWRLLMRRYNQAALLVQALAFEAQKPYSLEALKRVKNTVSQGHMRVKDRRKNVKRAFMVPEDQRQAAVQGKRILLIDDVYTTGATVNECAKVLKKAGAAEVHVLTIARVMKD